jgi:dolichol-phosphate mannosyltransferase
MPLYDCFVSVVAPVCNDSAIIEAFIKDVIAALRATYVNYELVLVDDGSEDDTVVKINSLLGTYENIRLILLSRQFGVQVAISAGLDSVIGDFVVVMVPNSDPPHLISKIVQQARNGAGVVFGIRNNHAGASLLMRACTAIFYWYCKKSLKLTLPKDSTQFCVLSRQAVNAVIQIKRRSRYLPDLSSQVGYVKKSFVYEPINRSGKPKIKSFIEEINLAIDIIITNSRHPLRFVSWLGIAASIINVLYTGYILSIYLFKPHVAEGWTTLSLQNAGMFFLVFLILTVLSEYIGRILIESQDGPLYYVLDEKNSSVMMADQERKNVIKDTIRDQLGTPEIEHGKQRISM